MGEMKDMSSPPHVKTWGGYITPIPPGFTPLVHINNLVNVMFVRSEQRLLKILSSLIDEMFLHDENVFAAAHRWSHVE